MNESSHGLIEGTAQQLCGGNAENDETSHSRYSLCGGYLLNMTGWKHYCCQG